MDTESLISKVQLRPAIWDKRLKLHANRVALDRCWKEIASEMGFEVCVLRKKWKYLRDQFAVESGKISTPRPGDPECETYEPKWTHFKSLSFLKEIVVPRATNLTVEITPPLPYEQITDKDDEDDFNEYQSSRGEKTAVDQQGTEGSTDVQRDIDISRFYVKPNHNKEEIPLRQKRRRIHTNFIYNEKIMDMKRKVQVLDGVLKNIKTENEDELFFRSLLPHVSKIPDNRKMAFRNRIQEVVDQFAYNSCSSSNRSRGSSVPGAIQASFVNQSPSNSTTSSKLSALSPPNIDSFVLSPTSDIL